MSDHVRLRPWSVVTWAEETVRASRGPGEILPSEELLAELENTLLVNRKVNAKRLAHPLKGRLWVFWRQAVYGLLMLTPLLAPLVMVVGLLAAGDGTYKPAVAFMTALAVSLFNALFLAVFFLVGRRQRVRRRNLMTTIFTCLYAVFTASTLVVCVVLADDLGVPIDWYLLPLLILLALCVASATHQIRSPRDPAWGHVFSAGSQSAPNMTRFERHRLHPDDRAWMLDERDQAVRILTEGGLLGDVDPDELSTRPLGELHIAPERRAGRVSG